MATPLQQSLPDANSLQRMASFRESRRGPCGGARDREIAAGAHAGRAAEQGPAPPSESCGRRRRRKPTPGIAGLRSAQQPALYPIGDLPANSTLAAVLGARRLSRTSRALATALTRAKRTAAWVRKPP